MKHLHQQYQFLLHGKASLAYEQNGHYESLRHHHQLQGKLEPYLDKEKVGGGLCISQTINSQVNMFVIAVDQAPVCAHKSQSLATSLVSLDLHSSVGSPQFFFISGTFIAPIYAALYIYILLSHHSLPSQSLQSNAH